MKCPSCGFPDLRADARFCPNCEQPISQPEPASVSKTQITVEQQVGEVASGGQVTGVSIRQLIGNVFINTPDRELSQDRRNLHILLEKVRSFWLEGVLKNSLQTTLLIDLEKETIHQAVSRPWERMDNGLQRPTEEIPPDKPVLTLFEEMGRAMLILGEPGSGKTTTLLELAEALAAEADSGQDQPVPVVLNLSTWSEKYASLDEWLVEELNEKYQIPRPIGRRWLDQNALVFLLDGLDEVSFEQRKGCLNAINHFRQTHGLAGLVVCSRLQEYLEIGDRLRLDGGVRLRRLTSGQVDAYLAGLGPQLMQLRESLWHDPELATLSETPLMLSILCLSYQEAPVLSAPVSGKPANTKAQVFDVYIRRMLSRQRGRKLFSPEQMINWLSWLAFRMQQSSMSQLLVESIQPTWLPSQKWRWLYRLLVALIAGLPTGLLLGFGVGFPVILSALPTTGWFDMLSTGARLVLTAGYNLWLGMLASTLVTVGFVSLRNYGVIPALISGLFYGFSFGQSFARVFGRDTGLVLGCLVALLVASLYYVIGALVMRRSPARGDAVEAVDKLDWSWSRFALGFLIGALPGFAFGSLLWWGFRGEAFIPGFGTTFGLVFGITAGANLGVLLGFVVREVDQVIRPNQGIHRSARNAASIGLAIWLSVGLPLGYITSTSWRLAVGPAKSFDVGVVLFLGVGLALGLLTSLFFGLLACIQHGILRLLLAWAGCVPLNLVAFLDSAAEHVLLQKVGGGYIFIHRLLRDHFADLYRQVKHE